MTNTSHSILLPSPGISCQLIKLPTECILKTIYIIYDARQLAEEAEKIEATDCRPINRIAYEIMPGIFV